MEKESLLSAGSQYRSVPQAVHCLQDLRDIFAPFGTVVECRILNRGDNTRCAGALVRMHSIAAASQAIVALNGFCPQSSSGDYSSMPLLVRFADSPEEKARKQARRDQNLFRQNRQALH